MIAAPDGFEGFLESVGRLVVARPQPHHAAAVKLSGAVRKGLIAAVYRDDGGRLVELKGDALEAQIGLDDGRIYLPPAPAAEDEQRRVVQLAPGGFDDLLAAYRAAPEVAPPSNNPEREPDLGPPEQWPNEEWRLAIGTAGREAASRAYYEREAQRAAVISAWREREEKRKAALAADSAAFFEGERRRAAAPPPESRIEPSGYSAPAPRGAPLFIAIEDVCRFAEPHPESGAAIPRADQPPAPKPPTIGRPPDPRWEWALSELRRYVFHCGELQIKSAVGAWLIRSFAARFDNPPDPGL